MNALIIVDVQHDFLPGGALGVDEGDKIIKPIEELIWSSDYWYDFVLASLDWHPENHISFKENGGIWPKHCVQDTEGANIHDNILYEADYLIYKGDNPNKEAYSAFDGYVKNGYVKNDSDSNSNISLNEFLEKENVKIVDICGLALDYCVKATALDAKKNGYKTTVLSDLTRPVTNDTGDQAVKELLDAQVILKRSNS